MSSLQPLALLYSLLFGVGLGLVFAALESLRILFQPRRAARFLLDIAFCLLAALMSFLLALAVANGTMRFFQAGGEIVGFCAVQLTVTWALRRHLPRVRGFLLGVKRRVEGVVSEKMLKKLKKNTKRA